jgi:hypothetical protein
MIRKTEIFVPSVTIHGSILLRYGSEKGRAIARGVSCSQQRTRFESRLGHVGFVVDKVALVQVSSEYFGFPCQSFYRLLHTHHPSSGAGAADQIVADVPSRLSLTPPQET